MRHFRALDFRTSSKKQDKQQMRIADLYREIITYEQTSWQATIVPISLKRN